MKKKICTVGNFIELNRSALMFETVLQCASFSAALQREERPLPSTQCTPPPLLMSCHFICRGERRGCGYLCICVCLYLCVCICMYLCKCVFAALHYCSCHVTPSAESWEVGMVVRGVSQVFKSLSIIIITTTIIIIIITTITIIIIITVGSHRYSSHFPAFTPCFPFFSSCQAFQKSLSFLCQLIRRK